MAIHRLVLPAVHDQDKQSVLFMHAQIDHPSSSGCTHRGADGYRDVDSEVYLIIRACAHLSACNEPDLSMTPEWPMRRWRDPAFVDGSCIRQPALDSWEHDGNVLSSIRVLAAHAEHRRYLLVPHGGAVEGPGQFLDLGILCRELVDLPLEPALRTPIWSGAYVSFGDALYVFIDPPTLRKLSSLAR